MMCTDVHAFDLKSNGLDQLRSEAFIWVHSAAIFVIKRRSNLPGYQNDTFLLM
jgi:hypothetical protein